MPLFNGTTQRVEETAARQNAASAKCRIGKMPHRRNGLAPVKTKLDTQPIFCHFNLCSRLLDDDQKFFFVLFVKIGQNRR
jgi:hypothetical protein